MKEDMKAIDIVRQMVADGQVSQEVAERYFPELKESENERIRKELIEFVDANMLSMDERHDRWIAWLEKQGEKLPVGFYYVNSEGKKFYSDTFKYGDVILHVEKQGEQKPAAWSNEDTTASKDFENESLAALFKEVDRLDVLSNKNSKVKRRGYAKTFARVCSSWDINTIKDLLKVGSFNLRDARNMGAANLAIVSEALYSLYGIDKW